MQGSTKIDRHSPVHVSAPVSVSPLREAAGNAVDVKGFCLLGGWVERPDDLQSPLEGDVSADVIVIGAGFAGLSTALELAALGANVIVIEREFAGFGASGRNAGYLAGSMGVEFEFFHKRVGTEQARKIVSFYDEGVSYVERRLRELAIDCDYNPSGIIRAAVHPSQAYRLHKSMALGHELGSATRFVNPEEMRARGIPPAFLFGCTQHGGTLDPGKYVMGLRRAALCRGVKLYEQTALFSFSEGPNVTCRTERGSVRAPFVVFATNAYTPQLGLLRDKVVPLRVSAIETEPLSRAQLESLGWPDREGIVTPHWTMESHRLTARDTLLVTTKQLGYAYGSRTPNVPDVAAYDALEKALEERFPTLRGAPIRARWSGYISFAYDALPVVGEAGARGNILYTAGCSGHGVGTQSLIGFLLAERIGGIEHPLLAGLRHKTPTTLPEPLQWCAIKAALCGAKGLDRLTNRKVRTAIAD
ncbi:FAD-dependent oxidoreductase [Pseudomonas aeruginosa]|uniref:NAD(P)/FAD-dependent oxidoreductase n=1 Tax=Pseudomonas aeruginosa TaxID=287 RepID=UPI001CBCFB44|nr:FAD-dependent oxidoreductase [Pseudomonas aeruginosa]MDI2376518.1 FAD-dependent oxidoreductase [Pseudomonas aeruginosa]MDI2382271.1 FAD-dependent oxidoreductase [Pseudomonas aeruginosa]